MDWKIRIFNNFPSGHLKVPYCRVVPWEIIYPFLCSSLLASYAKNKTVFLFKYYFVGNFLLKVNNKDIKIIFMDVVQVSFLLTLSRYVVMWQIFFTLYATWIHAPKLNLTKKTWVQICFKPLYKKWNFPLKISSVNGKIHFLCSVTKRCQISSSYWSISGQCFFSLKNMEYLSVFSPNPEKYGPEKTPYLDTFQVMRLPDIFLIFSGNIEKENYW